MDADLLGREIDWIQIWKGSDPSKRKRNPQLRGEYPSVTTEVKPNARDWRTAGPPVLHHKEKAARVAAFRN
jgi:hypothetical protein